MNQQPTPRQMDALRKLVPDPNMAVRDLAKKLHISSSSSAQSLLRGLLAQGLISLEDCPTCRRYNGHRKITAAGWEALGNA